MYSCRGPAPATTMGSPEEEPAMSAVSDVRPGRRPSLPAALACGVLVVLVLSGWHPHDRTT
ncbi:hypothetical protein GCM10010234_79500 [Streptomyces hawaiiensis]